MWTTSHQSSNGKPTRASWPRTSAVSGITCRSQWTQESILFFLTFLIIFYDFKIKWNKARTIVQVEAVDLDKRGTQNSHVRYEIIKVSSKILLLKTMLGKAMFGQNILIVFQDMECASPKMFDSVVCFRETTRTSSQSTRRAGRSRWWSLWSSSGTGEREDLSRRSSRSSRCRCRASSSCFRPGLVCSPDCSDCFTMVGLKWIIKSRNNDQNITSSLQVAISMYLSSHPTSKMVKETGFKKWKLGASIWLGNSIPWQRGAGEHIHPRHPEEVRSYIISIISEKSKPILCIQTCSTVPISSNLGLFVWSCQRLLLLSPRCFIVRHRHHQQSLHHRYHHHLTPSIAIKMASGSRDAFLADLNNARGKCWNPGEHLVSPPHHWWSLISWSKVISFIFHDERL